MNQTNIMNIVVVGCGAISDIYLKNMIHRFENLNVIACCANHFENAKKKAQEYGIKASTYEEILEDSSIEMVVILTPTPTHYELIKRALLAGKHVYTEKTMTEKLEQAEELLQIANEKDLYLGSAPDTFLGAAWQTAKRALEENLIGDVTGFHISVNRNLNVLTSMFGFLRMPGGGIAYDYGVYYLTALVNLLGPVKRTSAIFKNYKEKRINVIPESPEFGKEFLYKNESQVNAVLEMKNGITGNFALNGDSVMKDLADFMIYGTKGILKLSDANGFGGDVVLIREKAENFSEIEEQILSPVSEYTDNSRGLGPSEMVTAIFEGRKNQASKEMAYHILDVIATMEKSNTEGKFLTVKSSLTQ